MLAKAKRPMTSRVEAISVNEIGEWLESFVRYCEYWTEV
jgi:hypothetical protein